MIVLNRSKILGIGLAGVLLVAMMLWGWFGESGERADVVVIGAGASGMSAALEAESYGKDVILLEKMPYVGGNTFRATGGMNAAETDIQKDLGIEDSVETFINDTLVSGHYENNETLVRLLAEESRIAIDWLTAKGANLSDVGLLAGHTISRTHRPTGGKPVGIEIVNVLKQEIDNSKVDLRLENKAIEILADSDQSVSGVKVVDKSGKHYTINSEHVIIATGGFGGSPETFVYYNQQLKGYQTTNSPSATGDFITLVEGLNVALRDMDYIQTHPTVSREYGVLITEAIRGNGGILVNNQGMRFADELKNRDFLSVDLLSQKDREVYLIFNEEIRKSLKASDDYIDMKIIQQSESLEALSEVIRVPKESLVETVNRYNEFVKTGYDEDFGRKSLMISLEEGPYYVVAVIPGVHYCMGGIVINEKAMVLNEDGQPIKGLYASGEATNGIHGQNRLGGNSLIEAIVFGRIAGKNASSDQ